MQGFIVRDHGSDRSEFERVMTQWIEAKRIHWEETVTEGLENAPAAFINLFSGNKMGKALVKI
jgi:NADPH-dependent curcumin reductase CurA